MFPSLKKYKKPVYLDYAATTPLDPLVKKTMEPFWSAKFGNPSALYGQGREAKAAIDNARKVIAGLIGARPSEIIFTAGGTESVNAAIFGVARNYKNTATKKYHLVASAIEHHCVLNSYNALAGEGYKTTLIDVDFEGLVDIAQLKKAIRPETILVSVMMANNEIGTIEPIAEIGKWLQRINTDRERDGLPRIVLHTDACQAAGFLDLNVQKLGVDLMSANGSKIYGPKQTGFLYVKSGSIIKPLIYGGGQESGLRSGTENVPGIVGLAKAFELVQRDRVKEGARLSLLRDYLIKQIQTKIPKALLNGSDCKQIKDIRLPNNVNFTFAGVEGEALVLYLDSYGISASTASACSTGLLDPSHVLLAIGRSKQEAKSSIRFTLGKQTTKADLDYALQILPEVVKELKGIGK